MATRPQVMLRPTRVSLSASRSHVGQIQNTDLRSSHNCKLLVDETDEKEDVDDVVLNFEKMRRFGE